MADGNEFVVKKGAIIPSIELEEKSATPSNPDADFRKFYVKDDGKAYLLDSDGNESELGSGGSTGINYVSNPTFETNTDGYNTYADSAAEDPTDGTGGSANVTLTRTESTPLRGVASGLITKDAADRQGEGVSYDFSIDEGAKGKRHEVSFWFSASTNFVGGEDSDIRVWIYDKDNSQLIPLSTDYIGGVSGVFNAVFDATDSDDYRLIFHVATTNASAWTFKIDEVNVKFGESVRGLAGSNWQSFDVIIEASTTNPNFGSINVEKAYWRRDGSDMLINVSYEWAGSSAGSGVYMFLIPGGHSIDSNVIDVNTNIDRGICGVAGFHNSTDGYVKAYDSTHLCFLREGYGLNDESSPGSNGGSFGQLTFTARVPISGWDANVTLQNSSIYYMSNILANGTRVTGSDPTKLGEYRSYRRNAGALTYTETNANPTDAPSAGDGIKIYQGNGHASADTNNEPSRYKIYCGKNKHVFPVFYSSSGKTGFVSIDYHDDTNAAQSYGVIWHYDKTTGILELSHPGVRTTQRIGRDATGNGIDQDIFFEVVVSENALAVGTEVDDSEVWLTTANGHGSTASKILRYTTTRINKGSAVSYTDSSTNGSSFTIQKPGVYSLEIGGQYDTGSNIGISLNSTELTTNIDSITGVNKLTFTRCDSANVVQTTSVVKRLEKGDVVRPHDNGNSSGIVTTGEYFHIIRIGD